MRDEASSRLIGSRYQRLTQLGHGGMGIVFQATDRLTGSTVALKQLSAASSSSDASPDDRSLQVALTHEFRTLASLRHPNIITVLDYGFDDGTQPYFTMHLLDPATNLLQAGENHTLWVKTHLIFQVLQALAYLHRHNVIHCDLKPGNILVTPDGLVRLLDFGLASIHERHHGELLAGTPEYMAPEVVRGEPHSRASDLYAIGVMIYQLLAGVHPFWDSDIYQLLENILSGVPDFAPVEAALSNRALHERVPEARQVEDTPTLVLPRFHPAAATESSSPPTSAETRIAFISVLSRLLQKAPGERYDDARQVVHDLCAALGIQPPEDSFAVRESFLQGAKFVGRADELYRLANTLERLNAGQGGLWLIGGESGVGKSRLLEEVRVLALVQGILVLQGQAIAEGGQPYQLWREPLRHLLLTVDLSDPEASVLKPLIPDLERLLDRPVPDPESLVGQVSEQQLLDVIRSLFNRYFAAGGVGILVILEDLQWTQESLRVIESLQSTTQRAPLAIFGSYRDDEMPDLPKRLPTGHVLKLPRLSQPAIEELSAAILGPAGRRTDVVDLLERETEGNVFFLVEVLRALAENAGRLDDVGAMTLPASVFTGGVRRIVQRRLSKVPPRAYPLLKQAAVAGRQLDLRLLGEIAPAVDLDEWLTLCVNAVVVENYDGRWRFAHDKLREFLLEEISPPERATLHRAAAEALENTYADDLDRFAPALAHHWAEAGDTRKAGGYAVLAAQQALESSAYAEARRQFEAALEMRGHEAFENPVERLAALHHELGTALYNLNEYDQAREHHQTSLAMYRAIEHRTGISNALSGLGEVDFRVGLLDQAEAEFQEALDICEELQLTREIGYGYLNLGVVAVYRAEWLRARDLFRQALEYMEQVGSPRDLARALNNYAGTLDELGEKEPARALHYRALEIRERIRDLYGVASSLVNLAVLEETVGNIDVAFATYQRARELGLQLSNRRIEAYAVHGLGSIAFNRHQYDSARAYFQRSLELRSQINEPAGAIETIVFLGDVERESGNDRQALAYYQQALALSAQHDLLATGIAALHHLAVWLQAQHRPLAALTLMVFVSSQRSYPHQEDQTLMDELRAALPHAGVEQALRLGERLTFAQVAAAVASGSLDFGDELPA